MSDNSNNSYYGGVEAKPVDDFQQIQEFLSLCGRKWSWFVISLLITLLLAATFILTTQPVYERKASILFKDENSISKDFGMFAASTGISQGRSNLYDEMITLKSPIYMIDVIKALHLDMEYEFKGTFHNHVLYGKNLPINVVMADLNPTDNASLAVKLLKDDEVELSHFKLNNEDKKHNPIKAKFGAVVKTPIGNVVVNRTVAYTGPTTEPILVTRTKLAAVNKSYVNRLKAEIPERRASVIELTIQDNSSQRAEDVLNTLFKVYNQKWIDDINEQAVNTANFIDEELQLIESELSNVDADISAYKTQNMVPDVGAATIMNMNKAEATSSQLMELSNQLFMAQYIRKQLADESGKYKVLPANSGIESSSVSQQILAYNEKLSQRNAMIANSSPNNPLIAELDQSLAATRQAIIASLDNSIATISNRIADLRTSQSQARSGVAASPSQAKYLLSVERQQKVKEQLYIFLLQKREENQLSKVFTAYNTKMINPPDGKASPVKPVKINILIIALALGILLPMLLLFVLSHMDNAVRNRRDIETLSVPFVGEIPLGYKKFGGLLAFLNKRKEIRKIVVKEKSGNTINEAFRVLRTNLEFIAGKDGGCKALMFTSSFAHSGKTYISANLAMSFAIKDKKVLLIDLDMRKSSLSSFVDKPSVGIADYLSENMDNIDDAIVKGKLHSNLDILPVGTTPPNPTELLFSDRLEILVSAMREKYDYILIDCPPLEVVADASIINKLCDMTIYVIRAGLFNKMLLPDVDKIYQEKRYNNMVMVLNGTTEGDKGYGGYGYGYGYYGYGYHAKN